MTRIESSCNWDVIKKAFPLTEISINNRLSLRRLYQSDAGLLGNFMIGDPDMTWPRVSWTQDNVDYLLGLRLKHYEDYGFGVYGVLLDNELIGMAGIQVWEYEPCSVEVLVYIAKEHWYKGYAVKIMRWLLNRIKVDTDLHELYAAIRLENTAAIKIAKFFKFSKIGENIHYGYPATIGKLQIPR